MPDESAPHQTLEAWLKTAHDAGARTFACEILPTEPDGVRIVFLGLDRVASANSAWDVDGNRITAAEITSDDIQAIWEA